MTRKQLSKIIKEALHEGELNLSDQGLTDFPIEICELTNLRILILRDNKLTALPSEIGRLTKLEVLKVNNNQLEALPPEIGKLTSLISLDIHGNQIKALPPALYSFLHQADPQHIWGGLSRMLTPDGNILWLCDTHRQQYEVKPLVLSQ